MIPLAKALVFRQGNEQAAMVFCDLIGISPDIARRAASRPRRRLGIPASNILIHGTHTHTGPLYDGSGSAGIFTMRRSAKGPGSVRRGRLSGVLILRIVEAVAQAHGTARSRRCRWSHRAAPGLRRPFNRRFHLRRTVPSFNPGN